jgi:FkbM family methyltransferase
MIFRYIFRSIEMDFEFLKVPDISLSEKLSFLFSKYKSLISKSNVTIFGKKYFFDDKFGIATLQSNYIHDYYLKKFIPEDGVVIDIGANIGQFNFFSRNYLKAKKVYSFEPIKRTYNFLEKNAKENIYNAAVSTSDNLTFYIYGLSVWSSKYDDGSSKSKEDVKGVQLKEDFFNEKYIDLLKIDAEGAELDVIKACDGTIQKSKYVLIEVALSTHDKVNAMDLFDQLSKMVPGIKLVNIGRVFNTPEGLSGMADILFENVNLKS